MYHWTLIILMIIYTGFVAWIAIKIYKYFQGKTVKEYVKALAKKCRFMWPVMADERPDGKKHNYKHAPMITITSTGRSKMKKGIHKEPEV